jgi:hypothetical protein
VGSHSHAFRFVKKQKDCRATPLDDSASLFCRKDHATEDQRHESHSGIFKSIWGCSFIYSKEFGMADRA